MFHEVAHDRHRISRLTLRSGELRKAWSEAEIGGQPFQVFTILLWGLRRSSNAGDGSTAVIWVPVSTMKSNGGSLVGPYCRSQWREDETPRQTKPGGSHGEPPGLNRN